MITDTFTHNFIDYDRLNDGAVIVDGGACLGDFSKEILSNIPTANIYAIEPSQTNYLTMFNDEDLYNINLMEKALGKDGTIDFIEYVSGSKGCIKKGHAIGLKEIDDRYKTIKYKVKSISIKTLMMLSKIDNIDYLKLDIEGMEDKVIKDMVQSEVFPKQISVEVHNGLDSVNLIESLLFESLYNVFTFLPRAGKDGKSGKPCIYAYIK